MQTKITSIGKRIPLKLSMPCRQSFDRAAYPRQGPWTSKMQQNLVNCSLDLEPDNFIDRGYIASQPARGLLAALAAHQQLAVFGKEGPLIRVEGPRYQRRPINAPRF